MYAGRKKEFVRRQLEETRWKLAKSGNWGRQKERSKFSTRRMRCNKQKGRSIWNNGSQNQHLLCDFSFWTALLPSYKNSLWSYDTHCFNLFTEELLSLPAAAQIAPQFVCCVGLWFLLKTTIDHSSCSWQVFCFNNLFFGGWRKRFSWTELR